MTRDSQSEIPPFMLRKLLNLSSQLHESMEHPTAQAKLFLRIVCELLDASGALMFEQLDNPSGSYDSDHSWIIPIAIATKEPPLDLFQPIFLSGIEHKKLIRSWRQQHPCSVCSRYKTDSACHGDKCESLSRWLGFAIVDGSVSFATRIREHSSYVACVIFRDKKPYVNSGHHRALTNILTTEFQWLLRRLSNVHWVQRSEPTLPPRLVKLQDWLLTGFSEKEIALRAGLSQSTVHEYVKQLYRKLGVSSRNELMSRFVSTSRNRSTNLTAG